MFVLTAVLMGLFVAFLPPQDRPLPLFWSAAGLPAFCLLGCGAVLFAGEREAGTYEFQRALPVGAARVFAAKLVFALLAATIMFGLSWLLAFLLSGRTLQLARGVSPWTVLVTLGFFGLEMFIWATLFSLLSRRVLVAAILGVAAASLSASNLADLIGPGHQNAAIGRFWDVLPVWIAITAVVALVDFWLGARWFRGRSDRRLRPSRPPDGVGTWAQGGQLSERFQAPERLAILGRLVWQHWRQSAWLPAAVGAFIVPWAILGVEWLIRTLTEESWGPGAYPERRVTFVLAVIIALASVPLLGLCTFLPDQWGRSYRFLADRGVPPKYVWLSRQLTTVLAPIALVAAILVVAILLGACLCPYLSLGIRGSGKGSPASFSCWVTSSSAFSGTCSFASRWGSSAGCSSAAASWRRFSACCWPVS